MLLSQETAAGTQHPLLSPADVNECQRKPRVYKRGSICANTQGNYTCECPPSLQLNPGDLNLCTGGGPSRHCEAALELGRGQGGSHSPRRREKALRFPKHQGFALPKESPPRKFPPQSRKAAGPSGPGVPLWSPRPLCTLPGLIPRPLSHGSRGSYHLQFPEREPEPELGREQARELGKFRPHEAVSLLVSVYKLRTRVPAMPVLQGSHCKVH